MVSVRTSILLLLTACLNCLCSVAAHGTPSRNAGTGLVGFGISMWQPSCAYACQRLLALSPLECSTEGRRRDVTLRARHGGHEDNFSTSPDCYNNNHAFLVSLAWCMHQKCSDADHHAELWRLEKFWATDAVPESHRPPNYTYAQALQLADGGLEPLISKGDHLDEPSSLSQADYEAVQSWMEDYSRIEEQHARYGLFLVLTMVLLPLGLTLSHFIIAAASPSLERTLLAYVVEPALWQRRHLVSLPYDIGMAPLRGQALLISFILLLNLGLSVVHFRGSMPSFKYDTESAAFWTYWSNRVAYLSFANLVVVFLYSGRNNPLLALSGWSYGTFILLHRWVAYICVAQGSAHSLVKLIRHIPFFSEVFTRLYWNIGLGAFITFGIIFTTSVLPFRRRWYQLFLDIHNVLAVVALILCFFHVYVKFHYSWGFENWIVLAGIVWVAERLVRLAKIAAHGAHAAVITPLDEDYFEVTVEGISQAGYSYLYFPQGWWRFWESHPFSVASAVNPLAGGTHKYTVPRDVPDTMFELGSDDGSDRESRSSEAIAEEDTDAMLVYHSQDFRLRALSVEGQGTPSSSPSTPLNFVERVGDSDDQGKLEEEEGDNLLLPHGQQAGPCLTFLVRRQRGTTNTLFHSVNPRKVFIEGSYSSLSTSTSLSMAMPQVVCIVGGSGIAAVLPILRSRASGALGRTVLHWGCRSDALVKASGVHDLRPGIELNVLVAQRLNVEHIVRQEAQGGHQEVAIVTCGPASMADDVRHAVVEANRKMKGQGLLRLYEECYSC